MCLAAVSSVPYREQFCYSHITRRWDWAAGSMKTIQTLRAVSPCSAGVNVLHVASQSLHGSEIQEKRKRPRWSALLWVRHQLSSESPPLPVIGNTATPATRKVVNRSKIKELAETTRPDCRHMRLRLNLGCVSKQETLNAESFPHTHSLIQVMHSWKWCVVRDFKVTLFQSTLSSFVTNWCFRYNE